jgi:hypothetical protein
VIIFKTIFFVPLPDIRRQNYLARFQITSSCAINWEGNALQDGLEIWLQKVQEESKLPPTPEDKEKEAQFGFTNIMTG